MKRYWFLFFMGFFITAVNAVTMSWTSSGNVDGKNTTLSGSFSVVSVITTPSNFVTDGDERVLWTKVMGSGTNTSFVNVATSSTTSATLNFENFGASSAGYDKSKTLMTDTSYVIAMVFDAATGTLTWSLNGEVIFTVDNLTATSTSIASYAGEDLYTLNEITGYEGVLTSEELDLLVKNKTSQIPTVPEPTVFALLAMGIAGLVLKRRI